MKETANEESTLQWEIAFILDKFTRGMFDICGRVEVGEQLKMLDGLPNSRSEIKKLKCRIDDENNILWQFHNAVLNTVILNTQSIRGKK